MFPHRRLESVRFVEVVGAENEQWLGRTLRRARRRARRPPVRRARRLRARQRLPARAGRGRASPTPTSRAWPAPSPNPAVLISSSDAGAHAQMLCASGDTTLLLTRHVRDRGDLTLEHAIHELTGRQADVFGFHRPRRHRRRQRRRPRRVRARRAALRRRRVRRRPAAAAASRLRRPEGGYRATMVSGTPVQLGGELTGALPGRVISSIG